MKAIADENKSIIDFIEKSGGNPNYSQLRKETMKAVYEIVEQKQTDDYLHEFEEAEHLNELELDHFHFYIHELIGFQEGQEYRIEVAYGSMVDGQFQ